MGTNTIPSAVDSTVIPASDHNSIKEAMAGDLVPRNTSGVPTAEAGGLGTSSLPWSQLFFGPVVAGLSIAENLSKLVLKVSGAIRVTIGTDGIEAGSYAPESVDTADIADSAIETAKINDQAVTPAKMGALTSAISGASGPGTVPSTSYTQILSITISCTGNRPVLVFVTTGTAESSGTGANINPNTYAELRRGSTKLCNVKNDSLSMPPIMFLDTGASSGTNTYSLHVKNDGTLGGYSDLKLQAVEL
jgi:hypothetical protein